MMYFTTNSFPYVGSGWKEPRLSLSAVIHFPGKTGYHAATRHNPEGYIVPQRMRRDGLRDTAALACEVACPRHRESGDRVPGDVARKQPVLGVSVPPVQSQHLEQPRS